MTEHEKTTSRRKRLRDMELLRISDPLYELNVVNILQENEILRSMSKQERRVKQFIREILNTFEINRLIYLRQAGLAWLVFPSATHTRFAHSIGTLNLGNFATDNIYVHVDGENVLLRTYLETADILEEFLFCLLVHDIGHSPFSFFLEQNEHLLREGTSSHEELRLEYLSGEGPKYDAMRVKANAHGLKTIFQVIEDYNKKEGFKALNLGIVKELFGKTEDKKMKALSGLVEGVIDLDRIDNYNRDSYFMGLKLSNYSIKELLESIVIELSPYDGKGNHDPCICIREEGELHVQQLLFSREHLWKKALDIDVIRSYECMLNEAVDLVFKEDSDAGKIFLMTDDELMNLISLFESSRNSDLLSRIRTRRPYVVAFNKKLTLDKDEKETRRKIRNIFDTWKTENKFERSEFILNIPPKFGETESQWLDVFIKSDYELKTMRDKYENLISHFNRQNMMRRNTIRIFARDNEILDNHEKELDDLENALN